MKQKHHSPRFAALLAGAASILWVNPGRADLIISTFDNFTSDALYASWSSATIVSGPTSYSVTATGYGSNYKYNPLGDGTGNTTVQLTVTLSASDPANADGKLGPIITLVDGDGTEYNYAWYGQTTGHHVLTMPINSPTWMTGPNNGLDLTTLTHLHIQLDPSSYTTGQYTVVWEDARLIGTQPPQITSQSYNPATHQFTLTWTSTPTGTYTVQYSSTVSGGYSDLQAGIASGGASTTFTVTVPDGAVGFLRVRSQ